MTVAISHPISPGVRSSSPDQAARLRALAESSGRVQVEACVTKPTRRAKVITIGSGKGGVGKTAVAVNLAIALHRRGARVTVVDGDLGTANVDVVCGLSPSLRLDGALREAVAGARAADLAPCSADTPYGFRLVAGIAGVARGADLSGQERRALVDGLASLDGEADIVIIDAGAGIGAATRSLMLAADLPLIIATPEPASVADAYGLLKSLRVEGLRSNATPRLVLNQVGSRAERDAVHARLNAVAQRFLRIELPLIGSVGWDRDAMLAARVRRPLLSISGKSIARRDLGEIADAVARLIGFEWQTSGNPNSWWRASKVVR